MNTNHHFFPPIFSQQGNILLEVFNQIDIINQEIKLIKNRIESLEHSSLKKTNPYDIKPTPMENNINYINNNYPSNNYIIWKYLRHL